MRYLAFLLIAGLATFTWADLPSAAAQQEEPVYQERHGDTTQREVQTEDERPEDLPQHDVEQAQPHDPQQRPIQDRAALRNDDQRPAEHLSEAAQVLWTMVGTPEQEIPAEVLADAKCVAVVPSMFQVGVVVGARHGNGVASCRDQQGEWSAPAFFTVTGATVGPQIGAQRVDLVMLAMTDEGRRQLMEREFELGAHASVAAGPYGAHVEAARPAVRDGRPAIAEPQRDPQRPDEDEHFRDRTGVAEPPVDPEMVGEEHPHDHRRAEQRPEERTGVARDTERRQDADILTYARTDGLFAGANVEGAFIRADEDTTRQFYGREVQFQSVLRGEVDAPAQARVFTNALDQATNAQPGTQQQQRMQQQQPQQRQPY